MQTLREVLEQAEQDKKAIGHFNISNLEGLWAIFQAAQKVGEPVIIGVSEGERDFVGAKQVRALVDSLRTEFGYPIFLNADHCHTLDSAKVAIDAGFDAVIIDGSSLSLEENIKMTKECVDYAKSVSPDILVEAELGYIGSSSKMLDAIPEGVTEDNLTKPEEAKSFVAETGVDLFSPAVGNIHGMLKNSANPKLDIERIKAVRQAAGVPMVLHGGSGISDEDFRAAIKAGISIVHINTELRVAFRRGLTQALQSDPDEIAPYKYLKSAAAEMEKVAEARIRLFAGK